MSDQPHVIPAARHALALAAGLTIVVLLAVLLMHLGHSPPS